MVDEPEYERALRAELERRIADLADSPADAFGELGLVDIVATTLLCVIAPALLIWLYA